MRVPYFITHHNAFKSEIDIKTFLLLRINLTSTYSSNFSLLEEKSSESVIWVNWFVKWLNNSLVCYRPLIGWDFINLSVMIKLILLDSLLQEMMMVSIHFLYSFNKLLTKLLFNHEFLIFDCEQILFVYTVHWMKSFNSSTHLTRKRENIC